VVIPSHERGRLGAGEVAIPRHVCAQAPPGTAEHDQAEWSRPPGGPRRMQSMPLRFDRVAPVLPVRDIPRALQRYRRLGFHARPYLEAGISSEDDPIYGYLSRDAVEIHLSAFGALDPMTNPSVCYLFVDDADAVYAAWSAAGVECTFRRPADTTYGKREFGYVDPDGNLLRVGSSLTS